MPIRNIHLLTFFYFYFLIILTPVAAAPGSLQCLVRFSVCCMSLPCRPLHSLTSWAFSFVSMEQLSGLLFLHKSEFFLQTLCSPWRTMKNSVQMYFVWVSEDNSINSKFLCRFAALLKRKKLYSVSFINN